MRVKPLTLGTLALLAASVLPSLGCDNFLNKDLVLGVKPDDSSSDSTDDTTSETPTDSDGDNLSDDVEALFDMFPRTSDVDEDGYADGLEFVGSGGDPLNGSLSPAAGSSVKILAAADIVTLDPDSDLDGLGNLFEQSNSLDENNPDTDGDGYGDGLELVAGSDPFDSDDRPSRASAPASDGVQRFGNIPADSDSDGLADTIEIVNGSDINNRDTDGDGFSDGIEFLAGSNATNNASVPNFTVPDPPATE